MVTAVADFKDHFSAHAAAYATNRPTYPPELFAWLVTLAPDRRVAWDCATGSGQAAVELAKHFEKVIATDASPQQLAFAEPHENVEYRVAPAEQSRLADRSVDLVTVAQALHWFDIPRFYSEIRRVLKPGGILAVIGYRGHRVNAAVDEVLDRYEALIDPYWPPERAIVEAKFQTIEFPFTETSPPPFAMQASWDHAGHIGYLRTWSSMKAFEKANGYDPVANYEHEFAAAWGDPNAVRTVTWELILRVGS